MEMCVGSASVSAPVQSKALSRLFWDSTGPYEWRFGYMDKRKRRFVHELAWTRRLCDGSWVWGLSVEDGEGKINAGGREASRELVQDEVERILMEAERVRGWLF